MGQTEPNSQFFADFCRFSQICRDLRHFGGADFRRKPQDAADFRRKPQEPQIFAEAGLSHLVCPF